MLYDIRLSISYDYDPPILTSRNVIRLMPQNIAGSQQLISGLVDIEPRPDDRRDGVDFFGNARTELSYDRPLGHVAFSLAARVRRLAGPPKLDLSPPPAGLAQDMTALPGLGPAAPFHYLGDSERVRSTQRITRYAADAVPQGASTLQAVRAVGAALNRDMMFDPEATDVDTDPHAAFDQRSGVCQDFTHIMIAALRGLGIPAGYVSGFLRTIPPEGQPRLEGADAMHAWVRAWCGAEMGWVEYDPTNDLMVGTDHIVVATGRDYADVAPVKGSIRSSGAQKTEQKVDVLPL